MQTHSPSSTPLLISTQANFNINLAQIHHQDFAEIYAAAQQTSHVHYILITAANHIQNILAAHKHTELLSPQTLSAHSFKDKPQLLVQGMLSPTVQVSYIIIEALEGIKTAEEVSADAFEKNINHHAKALVFANGLAKSFTQAQIYLDVANLQTSNLQTHNAITLIIQKWQEMHYCLFDRYPQLKKEHQITPALPLYLTNSQKTIDSTSAEFLKTIQNAQALAMGMHLTKDLAHLPANICTPQFMAQCAEFLAQKYQLKLTRLSGKAVLDAGLRTFYSVSQGGNSPAELLVLEKTGTQNPEDLIALVGKGITFDTGGISLKPAEGMDEMKSDMGGAGSMLGALATLCEQKSPHHLVVVLACCENMPSATATRPGDVVTSLSGQTIEILNTDAEGRLVLCDALTYVQQNYKPKLIIDAATLTGACVVALAHVHAGLYSNHAKIQNDILKAGTEILDTAWAMPLDQAYHELLKSPFADIANIGGRWGGSVTAACFLQKFIENNTPWVHLDIAGVARKNGKDKGSSARPVPLLVHYLQSYQG